MSKEVVVLLLAALTVAAPARAFVPPTFEAASRGYRALLGNYRMIDIGGQFSGKMPVEVRLVIGETTIEVSVGANVMEKATYRVIERYGDIYRLEVKTKTKKLEIFEVLLQNDQITLYELDKDGSDKTRMRFERVP